MNSPPPILPLFPKKDLTCRCFSATTERVVGVDSQLLAKRQASCAAPQQHLVVELLEAPVVNWASMCLKRTTTVQQYGRSLLIRPTLCVESCVECSIEGCDHVECKKTSE